MPQFQTTPNGVTLSYTFSSKLQEDTVCSIPVDLENISKLQFPHPGPSTSPKPYHPLLSWPFEKKSLELTREVSGPDRTSRSVRAPSMNSNMAVPGPVITMV